MNYYVSYVTPFHGTRRFAGPYKTIQSALVFAIDRTYRTDLCTSVQNESGDKIFATVDLNCDAKRYPGGFTPDEGLAWPVSSGVLITPSQAEGDKALSWSKLGKTQ